MGLGASIGRFGESGVLAMVKLFSERESARLEIQRRLDAEKTNQERNRLGQFATPPSLASEILKYARYLNPGPIRFLDPALGTGAFFSAFLSVYGSHSIESALGFEVDERFVKEASRLWSDAKLAIRHRDFTETLPPSSQRDKANLIICNPPYVRHHHIDSADKVRLQTLASKIFGTRQSGLAGLYTYFVAFAHPWMADNAIAGWLIPSEFMDVNYGSSLKHYLLRKVTLLRVHRFEPDDVQFEDALVSSALVWFQNKKATDGHEVVFTEGGSLLQPRIAKKYRVQDLSSCAKWNQVGGFAKRSHSDVEHPCLGDLFEIKRGLATGDNAFFAISEETLNERGMPRDLFTPLLPSPRLLDKDFVLADENGNPDIPHRRYLLTCDFSEEFIRDHFPTLYQYLLEGKAQGVDQAYLCRHRSPWYSQEKRAPAPILCTYMGRRGRAARPFRFILNHSRAVAANVYLMLYPKGCLREIVEQDPGALNLAWEALKEISQEDLVQHGRVYGGGLFKLEPKELATASAKPLIRKFPALHEIQKSALLFEDAR